MKRGQKVAINVAASFIQQIVVMICGLITPRLILRAFGSSYNGVVSSATQLLSMISFLTLGIAGAVRAELYPALANKDHDRISKIMKAADNYMHKVGLCVIIYAALLMAVFPFISNSEIPHYQSALIIGIIAVDTFSLYFFGTNNYQLLAADQKGYIKYILSSCVTILNTIVIALVIRLGGSIFYVKGASALVYLITPLGIALYVKQHYRLDTKCTPAKDALKRRNDAAIHSIANIVHDNTDTLILTVFLDIKYVSVYTIYYAIVGKIKTIITETSMGIEAAIGEMWAKREIKSLQRIFSTYEYTMCVFVVVIFSCIGVLLVPFIELYTARVTDINYLRKDFALLITAAEAVFCVRQPYRMLVHATGFYKETKNAAMIEAGVNLFSSIIFVKTFGLNGVIIGTLVANIYRTLSYARFVSYNVLNRSMKSVFHRMVWTGISLLIAIIIAGYVIGFITITGWLGWISKGVTAFVLSLIVAIGMSAVFYRSDMIDFLGFLKKRIVTNN